MSDQRSWVALTVKPRHEKAVGHCLRSHGMEEFVPLYAARRRWSDRTKISVLPLFPGYVLGRLDYRERLQVLSMPGVISIVGFGQAPGIVTDDEIQHIKTVLTSGLPAGPWPFVRAGQTVRIERGSLAGVEGILLREKDEFRIVVSIELLQRSVAVEIDREIVRAVSSTPHFRSGTTVAV